MEEALRLYHAWLGYLLCRLGEETVRVPVEDIRRALEGVSCTVGREGDLYVIRLGGEQKEAGNEADE